MNRIETVDEQQTIFIKAIDAIDNGRLSDLQDMVANEPWLLSDPIVNDEEGYFKDPYLLYFIADNPIRKGKLPANIVDITQYLVTELKTRQTKNLQQQLNYTLGLVASGRIPRESGVQIQLIDLLIEEGAETGAGMGALMHGNIDAAKYIIQKTGKLSLMEAAGLNMVDEFKELAGTANNEEKLNALTVAAFYGNERFVSLMLLMGVGPNSYPTKFHRHGTPLHQAVFSGNINCVKLLIEAGADPILRDKVYDGTSLEWAKYLQKEAAADIIKKAEYQAIENYLENN